jgi:tetratricopeptide (TPR) repeat protein/predicted Ser/Thr protein kinase
MHERLRARVRSQVLGLPTAPVKIGRFHVLKPVGTGGLGVVYLAYDPELDRNVAIKVVRPDAATRQEAGESRARLVFEAQAIAKLSHPNVIHVYEVGEFDDQVFLAMEFVEGLGLRQWTTRKARGWRELHGVFAQAGAGLVAAHEAGLVHRDFKPDNVLVDTAGRAFVLDFGLATAVAAPPITERGPAEIETDSGESTRLDLTSLTRTGAVLGTPAYMAPEQFLSGSVDARTDQFSFCVALWEALYGERPFAGRTFDQLSGHVCAGDVRRLASHRGHPRRVHDVLLRGLRTDPDERFASMADLLAVLARDRGATIRRAVFGASVVVAVAGAIGSSWLQDARRRAGCDSAASVVDEVWNTQTRARVGQAIVATGSSHAEPTAAQVVSALDTYARDWVEARRRTCLAHAQEGDATTRVELATAQCLDTRKDALEVLVEILDGADDRIVARAVGSATGLPKVAQCEDVAWLLARDSTPNDTATRQEVAKLRPRLTRAWTFESAGRIEEAYETATALLPRAKATGYLPFVAEVHAQIGTIEARRGHPPQSRAALEEAYYVAIEAGDDQTAADAASELVWTVGYELEEYDRALEWSRVAQALLLSVGEPEGVRMASLLDTTGCVRDIMGDAEGSARDLERALQLREAALGPKHPLVGVTVANLGLAYSSLGRMDVAMEYKVRALELAEEIHGPTHPDTANSLNAIAVQLLESGDIEGALPKFQRTLEIRVEVLGPDHPHTAMVRGNIANAMQKQGRYDEAIASQREVLRVYEKVYGPAHPQTSSGLLNLGSVEIDMGRFSDARQHLQRTLDIRLQAVPAGHPSIATAQYMLGIAHLGLDDREAAIGALEQALVDSAPADVQLAAKFQLGRAYHAAGDAARGIILVEEARAGLDDGKYHDGVSLEEVAAWLAVNGG